MHGESLFFQAFVYLTAAVLAVPIAKRLGLGSVLGYLIAGVLIGPFALRLVGEDRQDILHFAEFGVVLMLFLIGLELEPKMLWRMRGPILGLGGLQVAVSGGAITGIAIALGMPWRAAVAVGAILALSSTAIVLQTLQEKGLMRTTGGRSAFSVLLFQDIAVIPMLALLPLLATTSKLTGAAHGAVPLGDTARWVKTALVLAAVLGVIAIGRFVVRPVLRMVARAHLRELFLAASLVLVIGIALLMNRVGLSPALGTFLAGVVLANSEYRHELEANIEPFKGLLLGVFFIAVGASIDFEIIVGQPARIAGMVVGLLVVKWLVLVVLGKLFRLALDQNLLFAFALAQSGEFAFVLFSFATGIGVLDGEVTAPLVAVVALSMAATPILLLIHERFVQPYVGTKERVPREPDVEDHDSPVIIVGFGRFGHMIGRFLLTQGVRATFLDTDSDHVDLLRKLGLTVYYGDGAREELLAAAGADRAKILVIAVDRTERSLEIARTARTHFPHLRLLVRARGRVEAYELLGAGIDHVYRETAETSLRVGVDALRFLGHRSYAAERGARAFLRHDERSIRDLAPLRHDRSAYLDRARAWIADIERLLKDEMQGHMRTEDHAWDTESLRGEFGGKRGPNAD